MVRVCWLVLAVLAPAACGSVPETEGDGAASTDGGNRDGRALDDGALGPDAAIYAGGNSYFASMCTCPFGEACTGGTPACRPGRTLAVRASNGVISSCPFEVGERSNDFLFTAHHGRCDTYAGAVPTVSTSGHGVMTMTGATPTVAWKSDAGCGTPAAVSYVEGATIEIDLAPGEGFPDAFLTMPTPSPLEVLTLPPTISAGAPATFTWTPGIARTQGVVELTLVSDPPHRRVRCVDLPDTGSFTVPAGATEIFGDATSVIIAFHRMSAEHVSPDGTTSLEYTVRNGIEATLPVTGATDRR